MRGLDRRLDLLGLGLAGAAATWVAVVALIVGGGPAPLATLFFTCGATVVAARRLARITLLPILGLVAAAPLILAVLCRRPLLGSGPLGYANASGALFFIAASAALMTGLAVRTTTVRIGAWAISGMWILIPWFADSRAAALLGTLLPLAVLLVRRPVAVRVALVASAGVTLAGILTTSVLGLTYEPVGKVGAMGRILDATMSERRLALWHDAVDLIRSEPLTGVGPGRFREMSPTALADRDALWAHNEYLEVAAETGVPGLLLLLLLVLWAFARLWPAATALRSVPAIVVLGGATLHANIDYVWHFPAVPLALAALVGAASAPDAAADVREAP